MAATITVTGKCGDGITVTAQSFNNQSKIEIDCVNNILIVNGQSISIDAATTITATKSGSNYTLVIS